jgi:rubredoxin
MSTPESDLPGQSVAPESKPELGEQYECQVCGYFYEPTEGDDRCQVPGGTPFVALPSNWRCPVCRAPKAQFRPTGTTGTKEEPSGFKENFGYGFGVNTLTSGQKSLLIFGALALMVLFFLSLYGLN